MNVKISKKTITILVVIIIILIGFSALGNKNTTIKEEQNNETQNQTQNQSEEETAERTILDEIEEELSGEKQEQEPLGPIEISITGPDGDTFSPGQARMWKAEISNFQTEYTKLADCNWEFYLNENNEEYLYKTQKVSAVLGSNTKEICGFTSTLIATRGDLRAKLILVIKDNDGNEAEKYEAERNYRVQ